MMSYAAPIKDINFLLDKLADIGKVSTLTGLESANLETAQILLDEAARFSAEVVAPLNFIGDRNPGQWHDGEVETAAGFKEAFRQFAEGGWQGLAHPAEFGGAGLSKLVATPCVEMLHAASMSFGLCALLTDGAIAALTTGGSARLKERYLPKLISGDWTGTMDLTEVNAGSNLALVETRAICEDDGSYRIFGTKVLITYGEHDMADNIVHVVLARTPGAPEGVKGVSLFVVPKFLVNDDGSLGERNDVHCISIEQKLGIKASPTAVLQFGGRGGAEGYLVGEENRGLEYLFSMMNVARFAVGLQGIAVSDAAYQKAVAYAKNRVQSRPVDGSTEASVTIIHHPDVRRMLSTMRAMTEGARALAYLAAAYWDIAHHGLDAAARSEHAAIRDYLVPIVKGWSTEMSLEVTSLGVQVHGGMGFIEDAGAAQYYRDARVLTIYEGTTAIQANDLVSRKTLRDGGAVARMMVDRISATLAELQNADPGDAADTRGAFDAMYRRLSAGRDALSNAIQFVVENGRSDPNSVFMGSVLYLKLAGIVLSGWQMARALLIAARCRADDPSFYGAKIATAHFFADFILPRALALEASILSVKSGVGMLALAENQF
jgi:alkylation response protein AidB-like acyl-CoA dehydrogenase